MPHPIKNKSSVASSKRRDFLRPRSPVVCTPISNKSQSKVQQGYKNGSVRSNDEAEALQLRQQHQASYKNVCSKQHIPSHASFALSQINSLLQYVAPGSIVVFDIDDTLIRKRHFGCSLLTTEGMKMLHGYLTNNMKEKSFNEKQEILNSVHEYVKSFVLAEDNTASVVKQLQNRGCYVFGLTARASSMASVTTSCLANLGIDLNANAPPTLPRRAVEPHTSAAVVDGIVYCNDIDKGVVFQRLLQLNWISWPNKHACTQHCTNNCNKSTLITSNSVSQPHHDHNEKGTCPERTVWFVDDCLPMVTGMINQWSVMAANQAKIYSELGNWSTQNIPCRGKFALVCCNYTHPTAINTPQIPSTYVQHIIDYQIKEYIQYKRIITDVEAYNALRNQQQQQQQAPTNSNNHTVSC